MFLNFSLLKNIKYVIDKLDKNFFYQSLFILIFLIFVSIVEIFGLAMLVPLVSNLNNLDNLSENSLVQNLLGFFFNKDKQNTNLFFLLLFIFFIFRFLVLMLGIFIEKSFELKITRELKIFIFKIILKIPLELFSKKNDSEIIRNVYQEPNYFVNLISNFLVLAKELILVLFIFILFFITDYLTTLIIFIFVFLLGTIFYLITKSRLNFLGKKRLIHDGEVIDAINSSLLGYKEIKISNLFNLFHNSFVTGISNFNKVNLKYSILKSAPKPIFELICISLFLIFLISSGQKTEIIFVFALGLLRILPSISQISSVISQINFRKPSCTQVIENINLEKYIDDEVGSQKKIVFNNLFEIKQFSFSYDDNVLFKDSNIRILKNKFHTIIGKSGSGKTSLINILAGLIKFDKNIYFVDGNPIKLDFSWRKKISLVSQNNFILDENIMFNIVLKKDELNQDEQDKYDRALKISGLDNVFNKFPINSFSLTGKNGSNLSSGQIQRIAIARKIFEDRDILILDEAINALDRNSAEEILLNIKKIGKTVILITHNYEYLKISDLIFEIENNQINEKKDFSSS